MKYPGEDKYIKTCKDRKLHLENLIEEKEKDIKFFKEEIERIDNFIKERKC